MRTSNAGSHLVRIIAVGAVLATGCQRQSPSDQAEYPVAASTTASPESHAVYTAIATETFDKWRAEMPLVLFDGRADVWVAPEYWEEGVFLHPEKARSRFGEAGKFGAYVITVKKGAPTEPRTKDGGE